MIINLHEEEFDSILYNKRAVLRNIKQNNNIYLEQYNEKVFTERFSEQNPFITIFVTDFCNLNCTYCFTKNNPESGNEIPLYSFSDLVDFIKMNEWTKGIIRFFGGEPLMKKSWILQCIEEMDKNGLDFEYQIFTNTTLFTEDFIDKCVTHNISLILSIEPTTNNQDRVDYQGNGVFERVKENVALLKKINKLSSCYARVVYDIDKNNNIFDFMKDVAELGIPMVSLTIPWTVKVKDYSYNEERLSKLDYQLIQFADRYVEAILSNQFNYIGMHPFLHYIKSLLVDDKTYDVIACGAGRNMLAVGTSGEIYPCHCFNGIPEFKMGTIQNLSKISSLFESVTTESIDACSNCILKYDCIFNCLSDSFFYSGDIKTPDKNRCMVNRKIFLTSVYILDKIREKSPLHFKIFKKIILKEGNLYEGHN